MSLIKFDYQSIKNRVLQRLSANEDWASFLSYSAVDGLISAIFTEVAYCIGYCEKNEVENFWNKARNKSSLLVQSGVHGYKPRRKQGCQGTLRLSTSKTFDKSFAREIQIPKFSQFSGGGYYFCTTTFKSLNPSSNYVDLEVIQGKKIEIEFVAFGNTFETKYINDDSVENTMFEIKVNDVVYTEVNTLFESDKNDRVYTLTLDPKCSGVTIKFGNDIYGKKLEQGDIVKITYLSTSGSKCDITENGIVNKCESTFYDSKNNPITCYVTNITSLRGGKDYQDIEEIRELSPRIYQTGDRASSIDDYVAMIKELTSISKILVWGAYEELLDRNLTPFDFLPSEENVVHISAIRSTGENDFEPLPIGVQQSLIEKLHLKCDPTDLIKFENINLIPFRVNVEGTLSSTSFTLSEVKSDIMNQLTDKYKLANRNFNESVNLSDIIALVDNTDGIDYCSCEYNVFYIDSLYSNTSYNKILPFKQFNDMTKNKIYIKDINNDEWILLASTNKYGVLISESESYPIEGRFQINSEDYYNVIINLRNIDSFENYQLKFDVDVPTSKLRRTIWYLDGIDISLSYPKE